ncbi:hypothetical protein Ndes2526B_g04546 [Nannochloris sp. 'desiccata']|nr:hypothetical protein NADE_003238 [Chlorella desiccata (nom. nud.)]
MSGNRSNLIVACSLVVISAAVGWWFKGQRSKTGPSSAPEPAPAAATELDDGDTGVGNTSEDDVNASNGAKPDSRRHLPEDDLAGQDSSSSADPPLPAVNKRAQFSVNADSENVIRASYALSAPNSPSDASPASPVDAKASPAKSPASTPVAEGNDSASANAGDGLDAEDVSPLERALVVYQNPTPQPFPCARPVAVPPTAPSSQAEWRRKSAYELFGEGEYLLENCAELLGALSEFNAHMVQTNSEAAAFSSQFWQREDWAAADMGCRIRELALDNPLAGDFFDNAIELWVKSFEAVAHAVFVLMSHEIPPAFAGQAELLGSSARNLQILASQWEWVLSSERLSRWQGERWSRATAYHSLIANGGEAIPRVLVVPYFGIVYDLRLHRAEVLLSISDAGLFSSTELNHLMPELIAAVTARDAACVAEQQLQAELAARAVAQAELDKLAALQSLHADLARRAAQAEYDAMVEASRRQKEQEEQHEGLENPFYDDLLS